MLNSLNLFIESFASVTDNTEGEWVPLSEPPVETKAKQDLPLRKNLLDLVDFAYVSSLGEPNSSIRNTGDVLSSKYNFWEAIDLDDNPDAEAVVFGKKQNGIKLSGIGHDGDKLSKSFLMKRLSTLLRHSGYWIEASGKVAEILKSSNVSIVTNKSAISKLFPDSKFKWNSDGSYQRSLSHDGSYTDTEFVFGRPEI